MIDVLSFGLGCLTSLALMIGLGALLSRVPLDDAHSQYDHTAFGKPAPPKSLWIGPYPPPPPGPSENNVEVRIVDGKE